MNLSIRRKHLVEEKWNKIVQESKLTIDVSVRPQAVSRPKIIQDVPTSLGEREELKRFFQPQVISFSLYDCQDRDMGRSYKHIWTASYLKEHNQNFFELYQIIFDHFSELGNLYSKPLHFDGNADDEEVNEDVFEMVLNGCFVLQVLKYRPFLSDMYKKVLQDMLILRNQIPIKLLKIMCKDDEATLNNYLNCFLLIHRIKPPDQLLRGGKAAAVAAPTATAVAAEEHMVIVNADVRLDDDLPVHLLDYTRRALLMRDDLSQVNKEIKVNDGSLLLRKYRIGTIRELKETGIRVKVDGDIRYNFIPRFKNGQLLLSQLIIDESMLLIIPNLIAYEMCPDFHNDFGISSFVMFMSSLIGTPEDVKELRSARILVNYLSSDQEVVDLFDMMDKVLIRPEMAKFGYIRGEIQDYLETKRGKIKMLAWMGEAHDKYFRSPWTIIALLAGLLGLVLTFIQTWFTIHPNGS